MTMSKCNVNNNRCNISALNDKAISLVQQGQSKNAVKLFLQALSILKSEVCQKSSTSNNDHHNHHDSSEPDVEEMSRGESPFLRVLVRQNTSRDSQQDGAGQYSRFDRVLALNPKVDPCAIQQRDGTTACLLYNMALAEEQMSLDAQQSEQQQQQEQQSQSSVKTTMLLKKAANIYSMAFSAAQHWKRWTKDHPGYQILCLAILNNLIVIHQQLHNNTKVKELHSLFRETFMSTAQGEIQNEEESLFAKNLQGQKEWSSTIAGSGSARKEEESRLRSR